MSVRIRKIASLTQKELHRSQFIDVSRPSAGFKGQRHVFTNDIQTAGPSFSA